MMLYYKTRTSKVSLDDCASDGNVAGISGGDIVVDQKYKATSPNPQSGKAVNQAVTTLETSINTKYGDALRYKGSKGKQSELPQASENQKGDVWNVNDTGANYAWNGTSWDKLSEDITGFATKDSVTAIENTLNTHKANSDTNAKHLTNAEYQKFKTIDIYSQSDIQTYLDGKLDTYISNGNIITNQNLTNHITSLQTEVQNSILQQVTSTLSGSYVTATTFNSYKTQLTTQLGQYLICDDADELKIYTTSETPPPLDQRQANVIYMAADDIPSAANEIVEFDIDQTQSDPEKMVTYAGERGGGGILSNENDL